VITDDRRQTTNGRERRGRSLGAGMLLSVVYCLLSIGCIDLSSNPNEIVAIEFPDLPWPSVVAGDTLRDQSGSIAPLNARLFDATGAQVAGQGVEFLSRDTTVSIFGGNLVVGRSSADGPARLFASGAGLQSIVRQLEVVRRPDSLAREGTIDTLRLSLPDAPTNVSGDMRVKVLTREPNGGVKGVRAWNVSFALEYRGQVVPASDTSLVFLVNEAGRPSRTDTTDAAGRASRRVRFKAGAGIPALDSVAVIAEAQHRGVLLAGAPLRLVLPVKPK